MYLMARACSHLSRAEPCALLLSLAVGGSGSALTGSERHKPNYRPQEPH